MKKLFVLAGLAAFVLLATGCATRDSDPRWQDFHDASPGGNIEVQIDSIAAPNLDLKGKTFVIASGMPVVEEADLEFRLVAQYVENALRKHGATRVEKPEDAELLIRIAYGIGDPQQISAYSYMIGWSVQSVNQTVFTRNLIISGYEAKKRNSSKRECNMQAKTSLFSLVESLNVCNRRMASSMLTWPV